jgi:integral membrane sensor domain MASE1
MPTTIKAFAVPHWVRLGAVAFCYFAAAKASLIFAIPPGYATAIWAPSGIALAVLLLSGARAWPGVWLGAALTNYSIDLSMPAALGIATGNTLEGICAAWLVSRLAERSAEFMQPERVFMFAAVAALASTVAATAGVGSLYMVGAMDGEQVLGNWYTWWQGDTTGILLVTPCILAWARHAADGETRAGTGEIALFAALLIATLLAIFARGAAAYDTRPLAFLVLPFFVWAACRFSERMVTLTLLIANGWAIWCTVNNLGPFQPFPLNEALLMLQAFTSTGALLALVLWSLLRQRAEALQQLEGAHVALGRSTWSRARQLRERIEEYKEAQSVAHVGSWVWDGSAGKVAWSEEMHRILGTRPSQGESSFDAYFERVDPGDRERVRRTVKDAYAKYGSWDSTERIVRPSGERRVVRSIGRGTPAKGGAAARMHGVCIDVTEREGAAGWQPQQFDATVPDEQLPEALRLRTAQFELHNGINAELLVKGVAGPGVAATAALISIAQEALDNVARHAGAHRVLVELECEPGFATLTVRDDGSGFAPDWQARGGSGVKRMRDSAAGAGGKLWIESTPGGGTTLRVSARG